MLRTAVAARTKVPTPLHDEMKPSRRSARMARLAVTGLTPHAARDE